LEYRLVNHRAQQRLVFDGQALHVLDESGNTRLEVGIIAYGNRDGGHRRLHDGTKAVEGSLRVQLFSRREITVRRTTRHLRRIGDFRDRRLAASGKQLYGGFD
jgi:hypothetical protein